MHLPWEVTHYKEFLRGQNHYDNYLLSGVSGVGARSFYYPEKAEENCNGCHMPLQASSDFGAKLFRGRDRASRSTTICFVGANTGVTWLHGFDEAIAAHQKFLRECMRVDIFGIREGGTIEGQLHAPLRPDVPRLKPGETYLLETVIRTLKLGHLFTQGTTDSNEVWLEVKVTSGDRVIGHSGGMDAAGGSRSLVAFRQCLHAGSGREPHQPPQRPGYLRAPVQSPDSARCRADRPLPAGSAPRTCTGADQGANCS